MRTGISRFQLLQNAIRAEAKLLCWVFDVQRASPRARRQVFKEAEK